MIKSTLHPDHFIMEDQDPNTMLFAFTMCIKKFVREQTGHRDPSHGPAHMFDVAELADRIFCKSIKDITAELLEFRVKSDAKLSMIVDALIRQQQIQIEPRPIPQVESEFDKHVNDARLFFEQRPELAALPENYEQSEQSDRSDLSDIPILIRYIRIMVLVCAHLHDVPDSKYDNDGELAKRTRTFLAGIGFDQPTVALIMGAIDLVSYSKENKMKQNANIFKNPYPYRADWSATLGPIFLIVRDIVSDADKITALGSVGVSRAAEYTKAHNSQNLSYSMLELKSNIVKHYNEKLGRLYSEFLVYNASKEIAAPLHEEMRSIVCDDSRLTEFLNRCDFLSDLI